MTDEAPTQVAATALAPGHHAVEPSDCYLRRTQPQLFAVDRPYVRGTHRTTTAR